MYSVLTKLGTALLCLEELAGTVEASFAVGLTISPSHTNIAD